MNSNVKAFIAILTTGILLLIAAYFGRNWLAERVDRITSDASGVKKTIRIGVDNWVGYLPCAARS